MCVCLLKCLKLLNLRKDAHIKKRSYSDSFPHSSPFQTVPSLSDQVSIRGEMAGVDLRRKGKLLLPLFFGAIFHV